MTDVAYVNTLISVADDCPVDHGTEPPTNPGNLSIAARQYAMIAEHPYRYTSGDVIFGVYADRAGIPPDQREVARDDYFSRGRPCLRASDLGKKYGWGIHCDDSGRLALVGSETPEYAALIDRATANGDLIVVKAMRSRRL